MSSPKEPKPEDSKPEGYGISKKFSVTEDLHIAGSSSKAEEKSASTTAAANKSDEKTKKPLEDIKEEKTAIPPSVEKLELKSGSVTQSSTANSSTLQQQQQQQQQQQPVKTLAEVTQKLKSELRKTSSEIEKSDIEFDRLVGNLEKKIEALRVQLNSSK